MQEEVSDMGKQLSLFEPSLNVSSRIKAAMREAIRSSRLSRDEISDKMRAAAAVEGMGGGRGSTISPANLDAWCSETKSNLIPLNILPIFCRVTGDLTPLRVLAHPLEGDIIDAHEARLLSWAKMEVQARRLAIRKRKILSEIEEVLNGQG